MGRCSIDGVVVNTQRAPKEKHILVPVDDTAEAEEAVLWTVENMYQDEEFHLFHCVEYPHPDIHRAGTAGVAGNIGALMPDASVDQAHIAHAMAMIERRFEPMLKERGVSYSVDIQHVEAGNKYVAEAICKKADELQPKAVVMSEHHKGMFSMFLHGSIAKKVEKNSHSPVILLDEKRRGSIDMQRRSLDMVHS